MKETELRVAIIGAGVIGSAIAKCIAQNGYEVHATRRKLEKAKYLEQYGIRLHSELSETVEKCDVVFFTVKPYQVIPISLELGDLLREKICISMAAGLELSLLERVTPALKWIRGMTNTCITIKKGFTVYAPSGMVTPQDQDLVEHLFSTMGHVERVEERFMDPLTALSGSGPAYFYTVIEALTYGGLRVGIPRDLACKAAAHTAIGASELLLYFDSHPAELRDQVVTPGGTTIEGLYELEDAQIRTAFMKAITAATDRGHELAEQIRKNVLNNLEEE